MWWRKSKAKKLSPDLHFEFEDLKGRKYYSIPSHLAIPIERFGKLQENIMWQSAGLSNTELTELIGVIETEIENMIQGQKGAWAKCGAAIEEMKLRRQMVLHTELMYHFLAIQFIREDEDPAVYDDEIQAEKVEAFKELVKKKDVQFLYHLSPMKEVRKSLNLSPQELEQLWKESELEQERMREVIKLLKSDLKSAKGTKTSVTN